MKHRKWWFILAILLLLSFGAVSAQAQEDTQPLDDEFVFSLVIMTVNHNLMAGKNEVRDLTALKDYVNDYYDDRLAVVDNEADRYWLRVQKASLNNSLDEKIEEKSALGRLQFFIDLISGSDDEEDGKDGDRLQVISGSDDPPSEYITAMDSTLLKDIEAQVNVALDLDIMKNYPSLAPVIADSSGWSYNVPAITDSTSPISTASGDDESDSGGDADFWGDASDGSGSSEDSGSVGGGSTSVGGGDSGSSSGDKDNIKLRPLRFTNNGFEPVTVLVETYEPAPGYSPNRPNVSTVVYPESNPSAYMELPLGTYTFCYYWQLDEDYNNDDYFDYHHRVTSSVTLNINSNDDPNLAVSVTLSPDSTVSNPNGKCGEAAAQSQNASGLTQEEQANNGIHDYLITCTGSELCEGESSLVTAQIVFSSGGVTLTDINDTDDTQFFSAAGLNTYSWTSPYGDVFILIFTMDGFTYSADYDSGAFYYTLQP